MYSDMSFTSNSSSLHSFCLAPTPQSVRSTRLEYLNLSYEWTIPELFHDNLIRLWGEFTAGLLLKAGDDDDRPASVLELLSRFLSYVMQDELAQSRVLFQSNCVEILLAQIESDFLGDSSIQSIVSDLPGTALQKQSIIRAYVAATNHIGRSSLRRAPKAAVFDGTSQAMRACAVFGGQGNTKDYLQELRALLETYTHVTEPILATAEDTFHTLLRDTSPSRMRHFRHGLKVLQWLQRPESAPSTSYLLSAPISFPLIGLLQLTTYAVVCWSLKKSPGEVTQNFRGMTGHSQGIVVAAVLSTTTTWESFQHGLVQALTILLEIGAAAQDATPSIDIPSSIIAETSNNGEGSPSPMLNV